MSKLSSNHNIFANFLKEVPPQFQQYWTKLTKKSSKTFAYRTVLLKEDRKIHMWYLIIRGTVKITKNALYRQYSKTIYLAEIGQFQIVGIQDIAKNIPLYTYTVNSSNFECINLTRKDIYIIYNSNANMYLLNQQRKRSLYEAQLQKFITEKKNSDQKNKERIILDIKKMNNHKKNSENFISFKSVRLNQKHQFSLPPKKSHKEFSKKDPNLDKLFKENLKNIIRRKITYQTKDYTLLKIVNQEQMIKKINLISKIQANSNSNLVSLNSQILFTNNTSNIHHQSTSLNKYFHIPDLI